MGNAAYDVVEEEWTYAQKPFSDSRPYRTSDPKGVNQQLLVTRDSSY